MLPDDMINEILINMNLKEFIYFRRTNKKHYKMCEKYFKRFYDQFDIDLKSKFPDLSYVRLVEIVYQIQKIIKTKHGIFKTDNYDEMLFLNYVTDNKLKLYDSHRNKNKNYIQEFVIGDFNNKWYISIYGNINKKKYKFLSYDVVLQCKGDLDNIIAFLADMFYHNIIIDYNLSSI